MLHAMMLFAQQQPKGGGEGGIAALLVSLTTCCISALVLAAVIAFVLWHLMAAYKALNAVSEDNRDMQPGMVFLIFIPLFGPIWHFFIIFRVASSLQKEFDERGLDADGDFGSTLGLWGIILNIIGCAMIGIILLIMWTLKIRAYTQMLTEGQAPRKRRRRPRDEDEDDDD